MKLLSWNVNGIRATLGKGFGDFVSAQKPDILCLQETKARPEQVILPPELNGYHGFWDSAVKPGYSGVAVFTREQPIDCRMGLGMDEHDQEGRILTLEYPDFHLVNVYTPNAQDGLRRLPYRLTWDLAFRRHVSGLARSKPVTAAPEVGAPSFSDMLGQAVNKVNETQQASNQIATAFEMGQGGVDLTEVMIASQKASISFQAMTQVRNKLVQAYQDIMQMPV